MRAALVATAYLSLLTPGAAQAPPEEVERERRAFAEWLASAPNSPLAAVAQQLVGDGIRLGPADSDIPLAGVAPVRIVERDGIVTLENGTRTRVARFRPVPLGGYIVYADGAPGRSVVRIFGKQRSPKRPSYYSYRPALVFDAALTLTQPKRLKILALDGIEVPATEVGSVAVNVAGTPAMLRVYRIPDPATGESDLMIYFRDATNGHGSYPAGRFLMLTPLPDERYRVDFNRARNPFCAYSSAYPCPAPWPGNTVAAPIEAGERYDPAPAPGP